jgi:hypothetical protein
MPRSRTAGRPAGNGSLPAKIDRCAASPRTAGLSTGPTGTRLLWSAAELEAAGVGSRSTINRLIRDARLDSVKIGLRGFRVTDQSVRQLLAGER